MNKSCSARDCMVTGLVTFYPEMDIMEAIHILVDRNISGAPVVDHIGNLIGMLSEKDCLKVIRNAGYHGEWGGRVEEYMNPEVATVDADASIFDVAETFINGNYRRYPVMDENRLVGLISRRDMLRSLHKLM